MFWRGDELRQASRQARAPVPVHRPVLRYDAAVAFLHATVTSSSDHSLYNVLRKRAVRNIGNVDTLSIADAIDGYVCEAVRAVMQTRPDIADPSEIARRAAETIIACG